VATGLQVTKQLVNVSQPCFMLVLWVCSHGYAGVVDTHHPLSVMLLPLLLLLLLCVCLAWRECRRRLIFATDPDLDQASSRAVPVRWQTLLAGGCIKLGLPAVLLGVVDTSRLEQRGVLRVMSVALQAKWLPDTETHSRDS
jgi:hypothetical protein